MHSLALESVAVPKAISQTLPLVILTSLLPRRSLLSGGTFNHISPATTAASRTKHLLSMLMPNPRAVTDGAIRNLPVGKFTNQASLCRLGTSKVKRIMVIHRIHMEVANSNLTRDKTKDMVVAGSGELVEGTTYGKLEA
jgi:hypothetical protein